MSLKKIFLVALATLVICGSFALPCQAQNTFGLRPLRWLGQGFSDGYHRHNPGYDTSYYNPYSAHNSNLISQSPEYLAIRPVTNQEQPRRFFNGVPFSVYAAPPELNSALQTMHGQQFQGSFSPSAGSSVVEDADEDDSFSEDRRNDDDANRAEDNDFREDDNDFRDDDNDFREDDNEFREDDNEFREDDNDFREDDNEFRDDDNEFRDMEEDGPVDMNDDDLDIEQLDDRDFEGLDDRDEVEDTDVDTSDVGGLSGLNDSLSFDFD